MKFIKNPSEHDLSVWRELAYISEIDRRFILDAPFGEASLRRAEALKFVERERLKAAFKDGDKCSKAAARIFNLSEKDFLARCKRAGVNLAAERGVYESK